MLKQKHREQLKEQGFTVVTGVLTEEECQHYIQEYISWIENNFDEGVFPHCRNSIVQRYKIGHLSPTWSVRLKSKPVFAELWGTNELLTSIDAVAIGRPPEQGEEKFHSADQSWLHIDQGAGRVGLHAYQGGVYLETADADDWVFECMVGSHQLFQRFFDEHPEEREASLQSSDYLRLQEPHVKWFRHKGCLRRRVAVPKGGLLLWDSRLVHNNLHPVKGRTNPGRWRFVVIVCMAPACWADKPSLRLKKKAYRDLRMTSHWPCNGVRLFPDSLPEGAPPAKHPLKALPLVATTMEAMQLAGVMPYNKLLKKSQTEEKKAGEDRSIPVPEFSPDYRPPRQNSPSSASDCGWVVVAVASSLVCALSIYVYVYILNKSD